jgi:hypothetical protein
VTTLTAGRWSGDFERINRHRALAELVVHNHNWLPWWLTTSVVGDFCGQAERFMRGEGLPPFPVRLWWAYKHWCFKRGIYKASRRSLLEHHKKKPINPMAQSKATGEFFKPSAVIPLAPGQSVEFVPVLQGHRVDIMDMKSGKRRSVILTPEQVREMKDGWHRLNDVSLFDDGVSIFHFDNEDYQIDTTQVRSAIRESVNGVVKFNGMPVARSAPIPNGLGDYPRPNCPRCHTPNPTLGTPLDPKSPSGWGDSFFTCSNHKCGYPWKWKKVFPGLEENNNKEGTATGAKLKGTDVPFHIFGQVGATVEQLNEAVKRMSRVACIERMTPEQRLEIARIQAGEDNACKEAHHPLATITDATRGPHHKNGRQFR